MSARTAELLPALEAATYADWFGCLAEPTRVRLLHAVATAPGGSVTVGVLTQTLGISQSTCSHHVRKLAEVGFLHLAKEGTATLVSINQACCSGLPHAADAVMGMLAPRPCCPAGVPSDVTVRPLQEHDWPDVLRCYGESIETAHPAPSMEELAATWLPGHRWVAEREGTVAGWTAIRPVSDLECYSGVGEASVYVDAQHRGMGVGKALLRTQVVQADAAGLWTLQTSVLTEDRAAVALHHRGGLSHGRHPRAHRPYRRHLARHRVAGTQGGHLPQPALASVGAERGQVPRLPERSGMRWPCGTPVRTKSTLRATDTAWSAKRS